MFSHSSFQTLQELFWKIDWNGSFGAELVKEI